jgi:predicted DNA-binding protein (MmcQ/YjbR family)
MQRGTGRTTSRRFAVAAAEGAQNEGDRMNGEELQERARARADELPGAVLEYPFGPDWEVYKVRNKVFMLMAEFAGESIVTLKADPQDSQALREQHDDITPGYHMNKKHWITLLPSGDLQKELIDDLVTDSYLLVVENLPRARRPVDPATFGSSDR